MWNSVNDSKTDYTERKKSCLYRIKFSNKQTHFIEYATLDTPVATTELLQKNYSKHNLFKSYIKLYLKVLLLIWLKS